MNPIEKLSYDETSPSCLRWNNSAARQVRGKSVSHKNSDGYFCVTHYRKCFMAHRIVWEMHNGPIPEGMQIDHISGDRADNKIENLRLVTSAQNQWNRETIKRELPRGVSVHHKGGYLAAIRCRGVRHRKWFKDIHNATNWIKAMRDSLHGEYALHSSTRDGALTCWGIGQ